MKKRTIFIALGLLFITLLLYSNHGDPIDPRPLTPAERLYRAIHTYAPMYNIPLHVAFNVARIETGYLGPYHVTYNHKQTSHCGAEGAMQIMPQYAPYYAGFKVTKKQLRDSIELNVEISMKMLRDWHNRYKDWSKSTGAYNTGKPVLNKYAQNAVKYGYENHWIKPDSALLAKVDTSYLKLGLFYAEMPDSLLTEVKVGE